MVGPSKDDRCQRGREPVIREDGSIEIPLTQGQVALVSPESYHLVKDRLWFAAWDAKTRAFYAVRSRPRNERPRRFIFLHRIVFGAPHGSQVDHENHDTLDDRRLNLRLASNAENHRNRRPFTGFTSRFKGVFWAGDRRRWRAVIQLSGRRHHLGYFSIEEDAARSYDAAAGQHFKNFAFTNQMAGLL